MYIIAQCSLTQEIIYSQALTYDGIKQLIHMFY